MQLILLFAVLAGLPCYAADENPTGVDSPRAPASEPAPQVSSESAPASGTQSDWPGRRLKLRIGQVTRNPDRGVEESWSHVAGQSPQFSAGLFFTFPRSWQKVRFFLGAEYKHLKSRAELSGTGGKASIESTYNQLFASWGMDLRPFWSRPFGFTFALNSEVWGEKKSKFKSPGFSENLGSPSNEDGNLTGIVLPSVFELGVFWEITPKWKLAFTSDARAGGGNAFTMGVDYVF